MDAGLIHQGRSPSRSSQTPAAVHNPQVIEMRRTGPQARFPGPSGPSRVRRGAATLDYILAIGVVFPLLAVILPQGRRAMQLVYEMTATLVAWPFM